MPSRWVRSQTIPAEVKRCEEDQLSHLFSVRATGPTRLRVFVFVSQTPERPANRKYVFVFKRRAAEATGLSI